MDLAEPLRFEPLFMERVWGGRRLETLFGKRLPPSTRIGESWELVDREDAQSVVHEGPLRGATLHELWTEHRDVIFGSHLPDDARFPLLFKILDAQERLSVQVHPPAEMAARLGGEPKTEMWYLLDAQFESDLYAGLRRGVTRDTFAEALRQGRVAEQIHSIRTKSGDTVFIPSGRIHAIGAGNLVVEVQQNSDTTYRVFDWNRPGLDGAMRELHEVESMAAINFEDREPELAQAAGEVLVECAHFRVEKWTLDAPRRHEREGFAVFTVVSGSVSCGGRAFQAGDFFLLPANLTSSALEPTEAGTQVLRTTIPSPQ